MKIVTSRLQRLDSVGELGYVIGEVDPCQSSAALSHTYKWVSELGRCRAYVYKPLIGA